VLGLARRLVRHLGYEAIALDAPDHGDRIKDAVAADAARKAIEQRIISGRRSGNPAGMAPEAAKAMAARAGKAVDEWKALLDDLGPGTYGYWGVSMGTLIGLPFVASEPRVQSAVLGLAGLFNRAPAFERAARQLTMPVLFLFQWDDELMSRESGLALFDAFGSKDKSMHINPGGHVGMPLTEHFAAEAFFVRTLGR
jgi:hypothetical protein